LRHRGGRGRRQGPRLSRNQQGFIPLPISDRHFACRGE
jgi:hypothetical protein